MVEKEKKGYRLILSWLVAGIFVVWLVFLLGYNSKGLGRFNLARLFRKTGSYEEILNRLPQLDLTKSTYSLLARDQDAYVPSNLDWIGEGALYKSSLDQADVDEDLPLFYYSPRVSAQSPKSTANQTRLIARDPAGGFSWYQSDDTYYLYQNHTLYTGWYNTGFRGWTYFEDGLLQPDTHMSPYEYQNQHIQDQLFRMSGHRGELKKIYLKNHTPQRPIYYKHQNYSILYRNTKTFVLSQPAGFPGSYLVGGTEDFYDMPMDVVGEVHTDQGTWLHVYIGYEELGWVKKDPSLTDYVLTYYSERRMLDRIETALWDQVASIDARVGASFINNETMSQVDVNSVPFFPASTQKIYVLGEVYRQYKTGELTPDTLITLDGDQVPGAGIIQGYPNGSQFSVDELVDLVVIYSDNTAANMLIDAVGTGHVISPNVQSLGLYDTALYGKYYHDSYMTTTPHDAALFFSLLYNDQINGAPYDEELITKFTMNYHTFLRRFIPGSTHAWNKTGLGETEQNDVATFVTPYGEYSLAVFTSDPTWYNSIGDQVGQLSLVVHDIFNEERALLWESVE